MSSISVVMPVYNGEPYLEESVFSVVSCGVSEIIVVDDGSTDSSPAILESLVSRIPILRVIRQPNQGEASALNRGLHEVTSEFVIFLSADDLLYPEGVRAQLEAHNREPSLSATYPDWLKIDGLGNVIRTQTTREYSQEELIGNLTCIAGPGSMIRTSAIRELDFPRKVNMRFWGDLDQWIRLSFIGPFQRVPKVGAAWRLHSSNASHDARGQHLLNDLRAIRASVDQNSESIDDLVKLKFRAKWHRLVAIALVQAKPFSMAIVEAALSIFYTFQIPRSRRGRGWKPSELLGAVFPIVGFYLANLKNGYRVKARNT